MSETADDTALLRKRLLYQSTHRGCKEMDFLLGNFAQKFLQDMQNSELNTYLSLLEEQDWDIYAWVTEKDPTPQLYVDVIHKIRHFK